MSKPWRLAVTVLMIAVTVFCLVMMVVAIAMGGLPGIGLAITLVSLTAIGAGFGYMAVRDIKALLAKPQTTTSGK
jgi:hypothetical protein